MIEQDERTSTSEGAQYASGKPKRSRSREEKIGRLKYNQFLLKRILSEIKEVRAIERVILNGLKGAGYFHFDAPMIQKLACVDQVDVEILDRVHMAGNSGIFPKDVAADLPEYHMKHYHISRRIQRMNRRLEHETGEKLFEKRGHRWALTSFGFETWGEIEKDEIGTLEERE